MSAAGQRAAEALEVASAARRTWGAAGLLRRTSYETARRTGRLRRREDRWLALGPATTPLLPVGLTPPPDVADPGPDPDAGIEVYGGLRLPVDVPPDWHRHPLTGVEHPSSAHWSTFSDARPAGGDVKDLWEMGRLGWLQRRLRRWAATGDETEAETMWRVVEDWAARNPPYRGPQWMCGQEASLRTIATMLLADALRSSPTSTAERRVLVARMVRDAVGRVTPTLGYALSQRNNHATSEAGFLWTASVLSPDLPRAGEVRRVAACALGEAVGDQVGPDGAYGQHSPTYHRVALHVLLWVLAVARARGVPPPPGVDDAVARSVPHLRSLIAPGSGGRVPALGGVDGALVIDLAPCPIDDLRPVVAHAAAASGQPSGLDAGPWDQEAAWFGLAVPGGPPRRGRPSITTHALTRGSAHAVVRAGPLRHRPAHADQLHVDVWIDGVNVARDPGSYRYTAPSPWGNALAGEEVHDLPRRPGSPQAVRAGRFFWRRWAEAHVEARAASEGATGLLARLELPGGPLRRLVVVGEGLVLVVDDAGPAPAVVRWNLRPEAVVTVGDEVTRAVDAGLTFEMAHEAGARVLVPDEGDPASGWWAPGYGRRATLTALEVDVAPGTQAITAFGAPGPARSARDVRPLLGDRLDVDGLRRLVTWAGTGG